MIHVTVRVGGGLGGLMRVEPVNYVLPEGTTVQDVLVELGQRIGNDVFQPSVLVAVNGTRVSEQERASWRLQDGDVISVIQAFAGG